MFYYIGIGVVDMNFRHCKVIFSKKDKTNDKIHKGFYVPKVPNDKAMQEYFRVEL